MRSFNVSSIKTLQTRIEIEKVAHAVKNIFILVLMFPKEIGIS